MKSGNSISSQSASADLSVTEILCEFPSVNIEKHYTNSYEKSRRVMSFLEFRIYASVRIDCKLTSNSSREWRAFNLIPVVKTSSLTSAPEQSMLEVEFTRLPQTAQQFESDHYKLREVQGLVFSSKSEDVAIPTRFFPVGHHMVCLTVSMEGTEGINATDCVFLEIVLPPLVAAIKYGVLRAVGYGQTTLADAATASYDPDKVSQAEADENQSLNSEFYFQWSCPYLLEDEIENEEDFIDVDDEAELMFEGQLGKTL